MRNLLLAILLVPAGAFAGGYVVPNVNARDLAMVGSPVAAQDSAAAGTRKTARMRFFMVVVPFTAGSRAAACRP